MSKNTSGLRRGGPGRKPGVPNKITSSLKEMILQALSNKGGVTYLETQADQNPNAFLALVGRVLPLQVQGDPDQPLMPASVQFIIQKQPGSDNQT